MAPRIPTRSRGVTVPGSRVVRLDQIPLAGGMRAGLLDTCVLFCLILLILSAWYLRKWVQICRSEQTRSTGLMNGSGGLLVWCHFQMTDSGHKLAMPGTSCGSLSELRNSQPTLLSKSLEHTKVFANLLSYYILQKFTLVYRIWCPKQLPMWGSMMRVCSSGQDLLGFIRPTVDRTRVACAWIWFSWPWNLCWILCLVSA